MSSVRDGQPLARARFDTVEAEMREQHADLGKRQLVGLMETLDLRQGCFRSSAMPSRSREFWGLLKVSGPAWPGPLAQLSRYTETILNKRDAVNNKYLDCNDFFYNNSH